MMDVLVSDVSSLDWQLHVLIRLVKNVVRVLSVDLIRNANLVLNNNSWHNNKWNKNNVNKSFSSLVLLTGLILHWDVGQFSKNNLSGIISFLLWTCLQWITSNSNNNPCSQWKIPFLLAVALPIQHWALPLHLLRHIHYCLPNNVLLCFNPNNSKCSSNKR